MDGISIFEGLFSAGGDRSVEADTLNSQCQKCLGRFRGASGGQPEVGVTQSGYPRRCCGPPENRKRPDKTGEHSSASTPQQDAVARNPTDLNRSRRMSGSLPYCGRCQHFHRALSNATIPDFMIRRKGANLGFEAVELSRKNNP